MAPDEGFGNNRLRTGFRIMPPPVDYSEMSKSTNSPGASVEDAIEISDDEEEEEGEASDDDGGMLINVDSPVRQSFPGDMEVDGDEEESPQPGRDGVRKSWTSARETPQSLSSSRGEAHTQLQGDFERFLNSPADISATHSEVASTGPILRDLSRSDLELQLRYAFFDVNSQTLDLNQPAVCLSCLQTGHAERDCPEVVCTHCSDSHSSRLCPHLQRCSKCRERGHASEACRSGLKVTTIPCDICGGLGHDEQKCTERFFPAHRNPITEPLQLWISCSMCASKSHLVGDCPRANQAATARWSLKAFAPGLIFNLSVGKGMECMEEAATNRGLRPEGLKIRGRASLHNAGVPTSTQDSDDGNSQEQFLRPKVRRRAPVAGAISVEAQKPPKKEKTKNLLEMVRLPTKQILTEFVEGLNNARRTEGKSQVNLIYNSGDGANPYLVDSASPATRIKIGRDNEQKQIIWDWVSHGKKQSRTRTGIQIGEAYLVSETKKLSL